MINMEQLMIREAHKDNVMGEFFSRLRAHGICQLCGEMVQHKEHHLKHHHKISKKAIHKLHMTMPYTGVFKQ